MASEFDLIRRYFTRPTTHTVLAVGDDAAIVRPDPGMDLVVSTDMLVAGVHFLPDTDPESLGWKALAVNLSDMAAMGAQPRWALLAAALPSADETWLGAFCNGFFGLAGRHRVDIIGGDTTRGPLNLTPTILGEVPAGRALTRSGARQGDTIWVSGTPGLAGLGLAHLQGRVRLAESYPRSCVEALHRPQPRVALGIALRGVAHAVIDISDGLLADLRHILEQSAVGAELDEALLPRNAFQAAPEDASLARQCLLSGGDDYELLFTAAPDKEGAIRNIGSRLALPLTAIGKIVPAPTGEIRLRDRDGLTAVPDVCGFDHFL